MLLKVGFFWEKSRLERIITMLDCFNIKVSYLSSLFLFLKEPVSQSCDSFFPLHYWTPVFFPGLGRSIVSLLGVV